MPPDVPHASSAPMPMPADAQPDQLAAAFRELHGARLHAFALLLTLGDAPLAATLAAGTLQRGAARAEDLRHPERAAGWLRRRVLHDAMALGAGERQTGRRLSTLQPLGVDETTYAALARLSIVDRAAVIASLAERLDRRDVDAIVGGNPNERADRARSRYLAAEGITVGAASRTATTSVPDAGEHIGFLEWLVAGAAEDPDPDLALHATGCAECTRAVASFDALADIELGRVALPASQSVAVAAVPLSADERWGVPPWLTGRGAGLLVAGIGLALLVRVLIGGQGALFQGILGGNGGPRQGVIQGDLRNGTAPSATPRPAGYGPGSVLGGLIADSRPPA
ncbi:MAG: hypothetical protein DLM71_00870, partial [Chloroflexi bacterium]